MHTLICLWQRRCGAWLASYKPRSDGTFGIHSEAREDAAVGVRPHPLQFRASFGAPFFVGRWSRPAQRLLAPRVFHQPESRPGGSGLTSSDGYRTHARPGRAPAEGNPAASTGGSPTASAEVARSDARQNRRSREQRDGLRESCQRKG